MERDKVMINLNTLCIKIGLLVEVMRFIQGYELEKQYMYYRFLMKSSSNKIISYIGEENQETLSGMDSLWYALNAAVFSYFIYQEKGIPEKIFWDTMKCFTRFINEHKRSYGFYGFDRGYWTVRQLSLVLFRVGELEYEMGDEDGVKQIVIHVPSDADLSTEKVVASIKMAKVFFGKYFDEYRDVRYMSGGWLLSPVIGNLITSDSNIYKYRQLFDIGEEDMEDNSYMEWVFNNFNGSLENLPENTSLQKKVKEKVLEGVKIGAAFGYVKEEVFK